VGTGSQDHVVAARIDPRSLALTAGPFPVGEFRPIAVTPGGAWFVYGDPMGICHLDAAGGGFDDCTEYGVMAHALPVWPVAFDATTGTIWVANLEDTVTRIDPP
jgi:hypothetical protein